jgi:menaquinone-dependent protoporphyrinogen oxidase
MSKILVVFATHYGHTRKVAVAIAERLRELGHQPDLFDVRDRDHVPAPDNYDAVVLGSRVELGKHATDLRNYVIAHKDVLERKPTAFFSVSLAASQPAPEPDPSGYLADFFDAVEWRPRRAIAFAGALPYRKYGWLMRLIMKRISRSAGHTTDTSRNHDLTDWQEVRRFAEEVAGLLPAETSIHAM